MDTITKSQNFLARKIIWATIIAIVGVSILAASTTALARPNFMILPKAQFVIDKATGSARVTYQGQIYQVNAGHYLVNAHCTISISAEAAAIVAPNLIRSTWTPREGSISNPKTSSFGWIFGWDSLRISATALGLVSTNAGWRSPLRKLLGRLVRANNKRTQYNLDSQFTDRAQVKNRGQAGYPCANTADGLADPSY